MNLFKNPKLLAAFEEYVRMQNDLLPSEEELSGITFSENFREKMRHVLMRQKRGFYVLFGTAGRRVASITVAVLVAATVTTVSVEALREPVAQFFTQVFERFTQVFFVDDTPDTPEVEMAKRAPTYVPEGYTVEQELDFGTYYKITYVNENGEKLRFAQRWKRTGEVIADTEDVQYTEIIIDDYRGVTYSNKEITTIVFSDEEYTYTLSGPLGTDELVKIAESIKI